MNPHEEGNFAAATVEGGNEEVGFDEKLSSL